MLHGQRLIVHAAPGSLCDGDTKAFFFFFFCKKACNSSLVLAESSGHLQLLSSYLHSPLMVQLPHEKFWLFVGRDEVSVTFTAPNNIQCIVEASLLFKLKLKLKRCLHNITLISVLLIEWKQVFLKKKRQNEFRDHLEYQLQNMVKILSYSSTYPIPDIVYPFLFFFSQAQYSLLVCLFSGNNFFLWAFLC